VVEQHVARTIDHDVRLAPAVRAAKLVQAVDLGAAVVDFLGKRAVAEIRSAGVVDDEITRQRRGRIIIVGARRRQPQILGEIPFEIELGQISAERFARRQAGFAADAVGERCGHHGHLRPEIAALVHAPHQTTCLLGGFAGKAHRRYVEAAPSHGLDEIGRPKMPRLALLAPRSLGREAQGDGGDDRGMKAAAPSARPSRRRGCGRGGRGSHRAGEEPACKVAGRVGQCSHSHFQISDSPTIAINAHDAKRCRHTDVRKIRKKYSACVVFQNKVFAT